MTDYDKLFIGGRWVAPSTDEKLEVNAPHFPWRKSRG